MIVVQRAARDLAQCVCEGSVEWVCVKDGRRVIGTHSAQRWSVGGCHTADGRAVRWMAAGRRWWGGVGSAAVAVSGSELSSESVCGQSASPTHHIG